MGRSLLERFAELEDPRDRRGRRYPLVALLGLCTVAILAGQTSLAAISQFGRLRGRRLGHALGFPNGHMPCANTLGYLLRDLDADHVDRLVGDWLADRHAAGWEHLALDGKCARGSHDGDVPCLHLLAAYAPQAAAVIAQMTVAASTNEHKAALRLLDLLPPLHGTVVTADAMFTHVDVCTQVLEKGGEYILYAKDNQTTLQDDLATTFTAADSGAFSPSSASAVGRRRPHGDDALQGARAARDPAADDDDLAQRVPEGLAPLGPGVPAGTHSEAGRENDGRSRVWDYQSQSEGGLGGRPPGVQSRALGHRKRFALCAG